MVALSILGGGDKGVIGHRHEQSSDAHMVWVEVLAVMKSKHLVLQNDAIGTWISDL